jgi:MFS family permease
MLVSLDLVRAGVALLLPFVTEVWQVYTLIFVLQSASAGFTPAFQATIPDVLPEEKDYTRALSLSRLAYDLESLVSPILAAALLSVVSFHSLFAGTAVGFLASAALVVSVVLPAARPSDAWGFFDRTTRGLRIYLATPRLRGLLAVSVAVAASGAMVIVNTVVIVQGAYDLSQTATALALATYGGGSMTAALAGDLARSELAEIGPALAETRGLAAERDERRGLEGQLAAAHDQELRGALHGVREDDLAARPAREARVHAVLQRVPRLAADLDQPGTLEPIRSARTGDREGHVEAASGGVLVPGVGA